ncbi:MAG TPA: gliding motility-associated C-terminal domain-containing protein, partial [Brumimicrobium sp.]|nr:gliding motility-associated C-terminal domain-containing protein [Brumimicrobium sp.]
IVFDSLVAQLPNVFTPNNDGTNDFFNVKVNLPVSYKLSILNRWGNVVFENEGELVEGTHQLWDGTAKNGDLVTDGTYFYIISFQLDGEEVNCEITECEVRKEGFVQVFGK